MKSTWKIQDQLICESAYGTSEVVLFHDRPHWFRHTRYSGLIDKSFRSYKLIICKRNIPFHLHTLEVNVVCRFMQHHICIFKGFICLLDIIENIQNLTCTTMNGWENLMVSLDHWLSLDWFLYLSIFPQCL